jgi:DEAD/DEAH box helicase domain-containing protein
MRDVHKFFLNGYHIIMDISGAAALDAILKSPEFAPNIVQVRVLPATGGAFSPFPPDMDGRIADALRRAGIARIYTHQAEVWDALRRGRNAAVVTPTASGKTLCYNLPVMQALLEDEKARALYLFPTKALSHDQQAELNELAGGGSGGGLSGALQAGIVTYDGDTPESLRVKARERGRIIISNPDMLHAGILPNHTKWMQFFSNLKYIVIDEAHAYRGVLGSHVANVLRRLKRIAAFYQSRPRFILCSATIANPRELAELLIGEEVFLVDRNGAPRGEKRIVLYNPPLVDTVQGIRRSSVGESRRWMLAFLKAGIKTILFAHSRVKTEVLAAYVNEDLANIYTDNSRIRVEAYRGGFLPNERREIEKGLREGAVQGVVSTNALELGIDIGGLDASVVAGFPGSFNSFWQQSGRAGRRGSVSVSVFIASMSPLDQFIMNDPEWFFRKSSEEARINPDNLYIFTDHVKCAAFELPFRDEAIAEIPATYRPAENAPANNRRGSAAHTPFGQNPFDRDPFGSELFDALSFLEEGGVVRHTGGKWHWTNRPYPAGGISLRSAAADNVVIIDTTKGGNTVIGEMDRPSAKELIFKNAVYIHRGRQYLVESLDVPNRKCLVREADVNYFTDGIVKTDIKILSEDARILIDDRALTDDTGERPESGPLGNTASCAEGVLGDALIRSQVTKFKKIRFHTHENIGYGDIDLAEEEMHTRALALLFGAESRGGKALSGFSEEEKALILRSAGTLIRTIAPVYLLCDPRDLGIAGHSRDPHFDVPCLYIYDKYPGGTGLAEALIHRIGELFRSIYAVIERCPCKKGCPSCVGPQGDKPGTRAFLEALPGKGKSAWAQI